ncbi:ornithine cyclodeaminase family protein [Micromonospora sp. HUAS LYJ1]|uniref:ornithine cyclodeaminase family protein n=1 Tax=Micromonospora sp. HUAS LYJ1 TaxID=3061626 RepID=UPI002672B3A9|nr:ornithine cyclodeaminase family protein [Micromonospora sp. HUAS LYJ1]WKU07093.1 ornithine cyclodeaminase family protein [Micromonospora sp. HUAS LYJ1]
MIVIDGETVRRLLPMADAVELMRDTFRRYSGGRVVQPVRHMVRSPGGEVLAVMPAHVAAPEATAQPDAGYGLKTVLIKPDNAARGLPVHVGLVLVFDPDTGLPAALIDAAALTAIRTAAASAAATDALARPDATVLAVLGAGVQARSHLRAMGAVRPVKEVRVWNHRPASAHALADWARDQLDLDVTVADTVPAAVADADVICTVTAADEPVLSAAPVAEGAHINAVGSSFAHRRELAGDLVGRCAVFVDSRESARAEAGDLLLAAREGHFRIEAVRAEVGEVLGGHHPGRSSTGEITLFKSLGLAAQDVVSGFAVYQRAAAAGAGQRVELRGDGS